MSDLRLATTDYDLELSNGDLVLTVESDAIRQHVQQRLWTFFAEWFLDTSVGVPYYQLILVKSPSLDNVEGILRETILATPGISELNSFVLDYDNATRQLSVEFQAKARDEVIDFSLVIGG